MAQISVRTQPCGRWAVRTCQLDHVTSTGIIAHATGGKIYAKYPKVKQQVEDSAQCGQKGGSSGLMIFSWEPAL